MMMNYILFCLLVWVGGAMGATAGVPCSCEENREMRYYFDPEELSEEEVSRRIKILKRNLEKVFPNFSKTLENEYISIDENATQFIESPLLKESSRIEGVVFVGENAPLSTLDKSEKTQKISHFVRGMISSGLVVECATEC